MVRCKHDWSECFRWMPPQIHWCQKCGTWRITLDKDCQKPGYKFRYFRPRWMKDKKLAEDLFAESFGPRG